MKIIQRLLIVSAVMGLSNLAYATCTGAGDPCNAPRNATIISHSATTILESAQNSATGNAANSIYFFQATTLGSAQNNGTLDRNTVIVFTADFGTGDPSDVISNTIRPLLATTNYNVFAKACPPGSSNPTDAGCSAWVSAGAQTTDNLTNAGFSDVASADTQPLQFTAKTNNSVADQNNVVAWVATQLTSTEVSACSFSKSVQPFPQSGTTSLTITSTDCNTLAPNRPYRLVEHLVYDPTQSAPAYTTAVFYTQPQPAQGPAGVDSHTHFSVTVHFTGNASNHNGTQYKVIIHNGGDISGSVVTNSGLVTADGGSTIAPLKISGLTPDPVNPKTFTAGVIAVNEGGSPWKDSTEFTIGTFVIQPFQVTFNFSNVTTNAATAGMTINDASGVDHFHIVQNGTNLANQAWTGGSGAPASQNVALSGLSPNTVYNIQAVVCESTDSSECSGSLPTTAASFTTTPAVPTAQNFTSGGPFSLTFTWAANGNPNGTTYELQYSTDQTFNSGVTTVTSNTNSGTLTINNGGATPISANTTYFARIRARNVSRPTWPDSAYANYSMSATTAQNQQAITINCNPGASLLTGQTDTCSATVTDPSGNPIANQAVTWALTPTSGNTLSTTNGPSTVVTAKEASATPFTLTASLSGYADAHFDITIANSGVSVVFSTLTITSPTEGVLTALGHDNNVNGTPISYMWALTSQSPTGLVPTFCTNTSNGTPSAATCNVTFKAAGTYVFTVTMSNNDGTNTGVTPSTGIAQVLTGLTVCPNGIPNCPKTITIQTLVNQTFTATGADQFKAPMTQSALPNLQWTGPGSGNFSSQSSQASFSSAQTGTNFLITATDPASGQSDHVTVNVQSFDISGAYAYPVPWKHSMGVDHITFTGVGNDVQLRIYTASGREVYSTHELPANHDPNNTNPNNDSFITWNIQNKSGENIASGVYLYVLESPAGKKHGKLIIIQ